MENKTIIFEIKGKPVAKQSVKFTRSGMRYTPKHITEYSNWVKLSFMQAYKDFTPFETPLRVELDVSFEIPKSFSKKKKSEALDGILKPIVKPDCDNISKNILDSLNGLVWVDDKQVTELIIKKKYGLKSLVIVKIESDFK